MPRSESIAGDAAHVAGAVSNPAFELLHPRGRKGLLNAGEFVDVLDRLKKLGAEWDEPSGVWHVPSSRRADVEQLLDELGWDAVSVPAGMRPATDEDRLRLKLPPAWTDVFVSTDPKAARIAIGTDAKGRQQSVYSATHSEAQAAKKFARIRALNVVLPAVDRKLQEEAGHDDAAAAMMLVRKMGLRPGSNRDTKASVQAFGASTLQRRHVQVRGDVVRLKFVGKKGVLIDLELEDADLARALKPRLRGKVGEDRLFATNEVMMRRWLAGVAPGIKPKDFRTLLATTEAAALMRERSRPSTPAELKRARNEVADAVAARLGNTRAMALGSYIDPSVFAPAEAQVAVNQAATVEQRLDEVRRFGLDDWPDKGDVAKRILGAAADTQELHTVVTEHGRAYTAARAAKHDEIVGSTISKALADVLPDDPAVAKLASGQRLTPHERSALRVRVADVRGEPRPRVLFMAGGPASGKTSALDASPELNPPGAVTINPDDLKEALPEYQQMVAGGDKFAATGVHEESSDLAKRLQVEAMELGLNVVVDGTGDAERGKFVGKIEQMKAAGYEAQALYVTIPTDEAVVRATLRAMESGRWVPTPELRSQHARVSANFLDVTNAVGDLKLYDNSGDAPKPIFEIVNGKRRILDQAAYDEFIAKQHEAV